MPFLARRLRRGNALRLIATVLIHCVGLRLASGAPAPSVERKFGQGASFAPNEPSAIPSFLIIGFSKGGTTDLHSQLTDPSVNEDPQRPDPPIHSHSKELALLQKITDVGLLMARQPVFRQYLQALDHPCANYAKRLYRLRACLVNSSSTQLTIDSSPMYVEWPLTPITLRTISTQSKVIVMLRDPLSRIESLYVHRTLTEQVWINEPIDSVYDSFFNTGRKSPEVLITLHRLRRCRNDTRCMEDGWRDLVTAGYMNDFTMQLFATGLYRYILAPWRRHYFQRDRVMVIDSHAYYRDRVAVMEQVVAFLYGRGMTEAERKLAGAAEVKLTSSHSHAEGQPRPAWVLSHDREARLKMFIREHVLDGLHGYLHEMREEGAWVVGFDRSPWPWAV